MQLTQVDTAVFTMYLPGSQFPLQVEPDNMKSVMQVRQLVAETQFTHGCWQAKQVSVTAFL